MSAASISPNVLRLLEKISHLTIEETEKVEDFINFLLSKKEDESQYSDIKPDNANETSTAIILDFLASSTSSQSDASTIQPEQTLESLPSPLYVSEESIEGNKMEEESDVEKRDSIESNHVIVAPEEPISENYPTDIDFADINARFAYKREEQREEKDNKRTHSEDLDWL